MHCGAAKIDRHDIVLIRHRTDSRPTVPRHPLFCICVGMYQKRAVGPVLFRAPAMMVIASRPYRAVDLRPPPTRWPNSLAGGQPLTQSMCVTVSPSLSDAVARASVNPRSPTSPDATILSLPCPFALRAEGGGRDERDRPPASVRGRTEVRWWAEVARSGRPHGHPGGHLRTQRVVDGAICAAHHSE